MCVFLECNCDNGGVASDYGVMTGNQVPIRGIYRLSDPSVDKGYLTLGPLICIGSGMCLVIIHSCNKQSLKLNLSIFRNLLAILQERILNDECKDLFGISNSRFIILFYYYFNSFIFIWFDFVLF